MKLPEPKFYLFGMGNRRKFLYKAGALIDVLTGEAIRSWDVVSERIDPSEYCAELTMAGGRSVIISEDEKGVWVEEGGGRTCLSEGDLSLPTFKGHGQAALLRALHHEVLINIMNGVPLPNILAYQRSWYRDSAMMCMCLEKTGDLHLVENWIHTLREPFDRNNTGNCEPDNLGQALYLISLVSDESHPLVGNVLKAVPEFKRRDHIVGITDGTEHPVYQTKWLKYGLQHLGLDDPYEIPEVYDAYSALFWMDYREWHVDGPGFDERAKGLYPYLGWAEAHFHRRMPEVAFARDRYPLTWEAHASAANYDRMSVICGEYVEQKVCAPHAWHAAEMFLYLLDPELESQVIQLHRHCFPSQ